MGRRIEKKTQEETIQYIYAGQNAIQEITTNNTTNSIIETRQNIYSNNLDDILSTIITDEVNQTTKQYYYQKNHLGSIIKITDAQGNIIEQYEYDAFGVAYASVNNVEAVTEAQSNKTLSIKKAEGSETASEGNTDELIINNIRYKRYNGKGKIGNTRLYTGREYEPELKLYYNRARYYSPDLGRFISRDPIDIADNVNLYSYVGNNAVMFVDRSGLESKQLQEDINNGYTFVIELVARKLDFEYFKSTGTFGVHTYIEIHSMDADYNVKSYSIGGHELDGKLEGYFNKESDLGWQGDIKGSIFIDTPEGMKSAEFAQNILDEYVEYSNNQKGYALWSADNSYDTAGNCNNFSTTILFRASDNNEGVLNSVSDFDPLWLNPGLGEYFIY